MTTPPIHLEPRLQARYRALVEQHSAPCQSLASGLRALPDGGKAFAAVQAAWRFLSNPRVTLQKLCEPLVTHVREQVSAQAMDTLLIVHDWSWLDFNQHTSKQDRKVRSDHGSQGYELLSALALCPTTGTPLAPVSVDLESGIGVHTSRHETLQAPPEDHALALRTQIEHTENLSLGATLVHIVDREADSVAHLRAFAQSQQSYVLRAREQQFVQHEGQSIKLRQMPSRLSFTPSRSVLYHGKPATQSVAETSVEVKRPYIKVRRGRREVLPGPAVTLRLIVSDVRDAEGRLLARWFLFTNLPKTTPAATIALYYYFRWRIECFFKLLKSAGWQIEDWQQESAGALAKRLCVVAMAAALVWMIQSATEPEVELLRHELIALSGRQMKRRQPVTAPALLAGLWTLLAAVELMQRYGPEELQLLALQARTLLGTT